MDAAFHTNITDKNAGLTLYGYLDDLFPFIDDNHWPNRLKQGHTTIDQEVIEGNPVLTAGVKLSFTLMRYVENDVNTDWRILWENESLLAIHKPANLPVHRTTRNIYNTLTALVRRESPWSDAHLLHRLDQETAGIVLMAKDAEQAAAWQPKFHQLVEKKVYHAIVYGVPSWTTKSFTAQLATRSDSAIRCQMHVCLAGERGKLSTTHFQVLRTFERYSVVECDLATGRKHQIRAHLLALGHPIVGDKIYANEGEFYLKRLANAVTEADDQRLQTPHHLLMAQSVLLRLNEKETVALDDVHYPPVWRQFLSTLVNSELC